jgi:hypothetical protein
MRVFQPLLLVILLLAIPGRAWSGPAENGSPYEVFEAFGLTPYRIQLLKGFQEASKILRAAGCKRVYLDGSFVTSKVRPNDFDALWDTADVDLACLLQSEPCFGDFSNGRAAQKAKYLGEFFPASFREPSFGGLFLNFFQVDKQTDSPKGIVAIDLREEIP